MPLGDGHAVEQHRGSPWRAVVRRLMSESAVRAYVFLAAAGVLLIAFTTFLNQQSLPWRPSLWIGIAFLLPLAAWLIALLALALPVLVILRGFSTRRDDGSLPPEKR